MKRRLAILICLASILMTTSAFAYAATCESLKSLSLEHTAITSAQSVAAGDQVAKYKGSGSIDDAANFVCGHR